jgi:hypothetical protein
VRAVLRHDPDSFRGRCGCAMISATHFTSHISADSSQSKQKTK